MVKWKWMCLNIDEMQLHRWSCRRMKKFSLPKEEEKDRKTGLCERWRYKVNWKCNFAWYQAFSLFTQVSLSLFKSDVHKHTYEKVNIKHAFDERWTRIRRICTNIFCFFFFCCENLKKKPTEMMNSILQ